MYGTTFLIYLSVINLVSGSVFRADKKAAIKSRRRVPERTMHYLEAMGGVFANILLMYGLRHKNQKFSYYFWTWVILIGWVTLIIYAIPYHTNNLF